MAIKKDTLDQLLDGRDPKEVFNKDGLFDELKKALAERVTPNSTTISKARPPRGGGTIATGIREDRSTRPRSSTSGPPRDREGTLVRSSIARYQRRFPELRREDRVDVCARHDHAGDSRPPHGALDGLEVSPTHLISTVTDEIWRPWPRIRQNRPLEASYPLVFFDAMRVKIRDEGMVRNKAVYIALASRQIGRPGYSRPVDREHRRRQVLAASHERTQEPGVGDILIPVVDGLKGFPEAINAVFPETRSRPAS